MPWRREAMKDVVSCDKLRVAAKQALSGDVRMGKPGGSNVPSSRAESIGAGSQRGELKHLLSRRNRKQP